VSFTLVKPGVFGSGNRILPGQAVIGKNGRLKLRAETLAGVGVMDTCVVGADGGTLRLMLRAPRLPDEAEYVIAVGTVRGKKGKGDAGLRTVNVSRGLGELGLDAATAKGRYATTVHEGLLILGLLPASTEAAKARDIGRTGYSPRKLKRGSDRGCVAADGLY
jgi:hypothetical protein